MGQPRSIVDISRAEKEDLVYVGKKAYELGDLKYLGIPVPPGFVIRTTFFSDFLKITGISNEIMAAGKAYASLMKDPVKNPFQQIRDKILQTPIPSNMAVELHEAYRKLAGELRQVPIDVFSSTYTDKSEYFPEVLGDANFVLKIKMIWANNFDIPVAVVATKSIMSEIKGKIVTNDPKFDKRLTQRQIKQLLECCKIIQNHFYFPKELEYAIKNGDIYVIKVNPFTGPAPSVPVKTFPAAKHPKAVIKGISVYPGIVTGPVKIISRIDANTVVKGDEILIIPSLKNFMFSGLKKPRAIIADAILENPVDKVHFQKNFQIPAVEGIKNATDIFRNGRIITVNGINGEIYLGGLT
jgi:phosphoenolpyruvate synthase/pyruvate phosphate dikinase